MITHSVRFPHQKQACPIQGGSEQANTVKPRFKRKIRQPEFFSLIGMGVFSFLIL